ncbi:ninja-family protein mc410 isoform X2 [Malania oleifera]|uniref:ninja-family protein mc410 isoform X2 n=1 Tax=Malania oleifera TaxID=397392 RepID=UPI0025AE22E0|nr:ninja-family protein mc410 isoform X2 [Malania oleifera]
MEDENGIELSLGLSCGGSSVKLKGKSSSSSDSRIDEVDKGNKIVDGFKNFLHAGIQSQDPLHGSQRSDPVKPQDNFFSNLSMATVDADASVSLNGRGLWVANKNKSVEAEEEKSDQHEVGGKRKLLFDETHHPKKQEREAFSVDAPEKNSHMGIINSTKTSHISINTEDGSTAENEDVAESEVEGSTSRSASQHEEGTKRYTAIGGSSEVPKDIHGFTDANVVKVGNVTYGVPFAVQPLNIMNVPFSLPVKESNPVGAPSTSGYSLPAIMQLPPASNGERPRTQPANVGNLPLAFGYSSVQLPMLDKDHTWSLGSNPQQFPASYAGRSSGGVTPSPDKHNDALKISQAAVQVSPHTSTEAGIYEGRALELPKGDGKQHASEEGSSSQVEDDVKGNNMIPRAKDASDQLAAEIFSLEGPGPNGRTISGVTYRFNRNQVKIVCACHGSHMTPEEFIQHAGEEHAGPDGGAGLTSFPNGNPPTSGQS